MKINYKYEPQINILIRENIYNDILSLVNSTELEMTLILETNRIDKYTFEIIGYLIPPQWNEYAETKTLDSKYPQWCIEQIKEGHKLNGHMHSHPRMAVSPSGYDITFFNELAKETNSFQLRFIINQKGFITADIIDNENNYIAEECEVSIICKDFMVITSQDKISVLAEEKAINNMAKNGKLSTNSNFEVILKSDLLTVSKSNIIPTLTQKYTPTRKSETDEGVSPKLPYYSTSYRYDDNKNTNNSNKYTLRGNLFNNDFYGYSDEEIALAKEMRMSREELDEYLSEMEEYNNGYSK